MSRLWQRAASCSAEFIVTGPAGPKEVEPQTAPAALSLLISVMTSLSKEAQSEGHEAALRQSTMQSSSFDELQLEGQHPSPFVHEVMGLWSQVTLHVDGLPDMTSDVHGFPSSQLVGQLDGGSQVSPSSIAPLPHSAAQSLSVVLLHPSGQQPSPFVHEVMGG